MNWPRCDQQDAELVLAEFEKHGIELTPEDTDIILNSSLEDLTDVVGEIWKREGDFRKNPILPELMGYILFKAAGILL